MSEITDVDTRAAAEIDHVTQATCPRCEAERLDGVPFCTTCHLRFVADFPPVPPSPGPRRRRLTWKLLLPLVALVAAATVVAFVLVG
ncbi:hypothetical protein EKO23_00285 [Nocardioides guangzhouensis]|uniref:Uncharacterized protein n=1 Tax=Nocardioides guangzhouensis TaxID=2497878 RepID=A0A4Q4ZMY9_9ACTN|nr:hypothetical protein [Nocardioides guangzhouensis]RYP88916.1 hypothetical protein EKO23_00285 [Nocardioides guangzhouensis]